MARTDSIRAFNILAVARSHIVFGNGKRNKAEYNAALNNPAAQALIVTQVEVNHSKLADIIEWLRTNAKWDGRAPAGFDTRKKSWGSSGRRNFWAPGSSIAVQGSKVSDGITHLTMYFAADLADTAMLLKLTF